jgi:hypothetical protein
MIGKQAAAIATSTADYLAFFSQLHLDKSRFMSPHQHMPFLLFLLSEGR